MFVYILCSINDCIIKQFQIFKKCNIALEYLFILMSKRGEGKHSWLISSTLSAVEKINQEKGRIFTLADWKGRVCYAPVSSSFWPPSVSPLFFPFFFFFFCFSFPSTLLLLLLLFSSLPPLSFFANERGVEEGEKGCRPRRSPVRRPCIIV